MGPALAELAPDRMVAALDPEVRGQGQKEWDGLQ